MNESISRAAGAAHGQEMPPARMNELIRAAGRTPKQRSTLYGEVSLARIEAAINADQREDVFNTPIPRRVRKHRGRALA